VTQWIDRWCPRAVDAVAALAGIVAKAPIPGDQAAVTSRITTSAAHQFDSVG
jgi:hypothetical protein